MSDRIFPGTWLGRAIYFAAAMAILFFDLLPLSFTPRLAPGPDIMFGLTLAVLLRRPEFAPPWLIALVFFMSDILLMRPPGLWTAIMLGVASLTRGQDDRFRERAFLLEWGYAAGIILAAMLAQRAILFVTLVPQIGTGMAMLHYLVTVAVYPLIVFFCYAFLGIRKVTPGVAIRFGHRS